MVHRDCLGAGHKLVGVARLHRWSHRLHCIVSLHLLWVVPEHVWVASSLGLGRHVHGVVLRRRTNRMRLWCHLSVGVGRGLVGLHWLPLCEHAGELRALVLLLGEDLPLGAHHPVDRLLER